MLINVTENKRLYKELVEKKFKSFLNFMTNIATDLGQYPGFDSSREMLHSYNLLWNFMKTIELDIIGFCAGARLKNSKSWMPED